MFDGLLATTVIGKAIAAGTVAVHRTNPRDFGLGNYRQVDDTPYGGGPGHDHARRADRGGAGRDRGGARALAPHPADAARAALRSGGARGAGARGRASRWSAGATRASTNASARPGRRPALHRRLRAGGRRAGGGGRARGRPRGWFRACSAAGCRAGDESFSAGRLEYPQWTRPAEWNGPGACRPCCCRATTRRSPAGVGGRRCG